ncbi:MAG: LytTR family DNA-binding domain-containing protein [Paludibacter sp.]
MIKVLIIEDEQPAAKRLEKMLLEIAPDFEIVHRCDSIETSVQFFKSGIMPDLVMLDVQLGDGLSFDIFKQVEISCPVIFTTAYDEYAIKAFELNSIDYLLKPISKEKLEKSIEKFRKLSQHTVQSEWKTLASLMDKEKREYKQRFLVYVGEHLLSVQISDIAYFYSIEKSTFLTTKTGKSYPLDLSLEKLEGMLSPKDFFRINRQYITSFESIKKMNVLSKSRIKLTLDPLPSDEVLISNARTRDFREWLDR